MNHNISRRALLVTLSGSVVALGAVLRGQAQTAASKTPISVFKDPSCGCCEKWVDHMTANGFAPAVTNGDMAPIKKMYKVPPALGSCHTAVVGGYVIEGHVPAADVRKLLATKPAGIVGLTIPGMPASAPGMDGMPFQPYDVLTFDAAGKTTVFAKHVKP
jgi:hypothetical protein